MIGNSRRLLPPIGALSTFVAAARYGSFSRAGDEVGLTQSAVSRQVASLEDWLQLRLFHRKGRRIELSSDGDAYMKAVAPALDQIRMATSAAIARRSEREINIATLPSFGMRWLAPRLARLSARHPDIVVNFSARSFPFNFAHEPFDAAIHVGDPGEWAGASLQLLFHETSIPVCSPTRLAQQPIASAQDVLAMPLLVQASRRDAWRKWLIEAGVEALPPAPSASFEHFLMLAQAAVAGAGIALIPEFLVETELAEGSLVRPLTIAVKNEHGYYFAIPADRPVSSGLEDFKAWLLDECGVSVARADASDRKVADGSVIPNAAPRKRAS